PDITTDLEHLAPITISLIFKSIIFDYGTAYHFEHKSIPDAVDFSISDEEFDDFVTWLSDKDFDYTTRVENSLEKLVGQAKQEKHYQEIKNEIEILKNKVKHNKDADLITFRAEIKEVLEEEIASRYYFQEGIIEASFDQDKDVQRAIQVLHNQEEYKSLLVKN
ncbi:MAG: peptidase S41, partial [Bacteroidetes bacterium]|nr:peptidase S41 [Bacteroidota bacterium]